MGRFTAGNNADPERLQRIMNAKQRLIGVRLAPDHALLISPRNCLGLSGAMPPPPADDDLGVVQVDVQALDSQVKSRKHAKEQAAAEEQ
jgi:hypothetical protein